MACVTCMETEMGCLTEEICGSQTLQKLAEQLKVNMDGTVPPVEIDEELSVVNWRRKRAAVLICLFEGNDGELRVILTKRSMNLASHPGDVALPGGKMEEGDTDDTATALREAMEEIGLDPNLVQVAGHLEPFISQHHLKVVPVVGLLARIEDFQPVLNTDEVDAVFDVPLEMFLKEENHRWEEKEWMGWKYALHLFDFKSEKGIFLIWGLTASILIEAASVIYRQSPCFKHHLPDFQRLQKALDGIVA